MIYITSDLHLNHFNILAYSNRPWPTVEAMNEALIANWNATVSPSDTVYCLGDFAMGQKDQHKGFFDRLQGRKILVRGNHDPSPVKLKELGIAWDEVMISNLTNIDGKRIYMAHIPVGYDSYVGRGYKPEFVPAPPPPSDYDYWLCGHVHGAWTRCLTNDKIINVGVDVRGYTPRTLEELLR